VDGLEKVSPKLICRSETSKRLPLIPRYFLKVGDSNMALAYTPAVKGGANPASGSYRLDPQYVNSSVDILQATYGYNLNGTANADQLLQRDAILAVLEYALKDTAFVNAIQAVAAGAGVTTPASFVSACVTKLTA